MADNKPMVTVGCKLPSGLHLTLQSAKEETPIAGGRPVRSYFPVGDRVTLNGANAANVIGGFGFTEVDAGFMHEWMKQNADFPPVQRGLVFIQDRPDKARDQAKDQAGIRSGSEPLDPAHLPKGIAPEDGKKV